MRATLGFLFLAGIAPLAFANLTLKENERPGHVGWLPNKAARNGEIEGYASRTSVNRGETIAIYVNTAEPSYRLEVFRMGWYGGKGGRRVHSRILEGRVQPPPVTDPETGLVECRWEDPYKITIPTTSEWPSGVYLTKLTALKSKADSYVVFVVRDDARAADLLFQSSVTTFQAYNNWGGKSLYPYNSSNGKQAFRVSFNRPYSFSEGNGASNFAFGGGWELCMVRFLEREGFDVKYATNIDVHDGPQRLLSQKAFLSVGHDEYWSWEMREAVTAARDRGIHIGVFSANTCYWQIRLEPGHDGTPHRTVVAYKERAHRIDPLVKDSDPSNDHLVTTKWRNKPVVRPEAALLGVMYAASPVKGDIVVETAGHWVFEGTNLQQGSKLEGLLGYEVDAMSDASPPNTVRLARSPFVEDGVTREAHMTIYQAPSGAWVFNTGSIYWNWGLDDYNEKVRKVRTNPAAQKITRNVLNRFVGRAPGMQ
jgi:hypothetical protein